VDLAFKTAKVQAVLTELGGRQELIVECDGEASRAINFIDLTGPCAVGDAVTINTTAVDLELGTGGWHFVMAVYGRCASLQGPGHIMKLRYTPVQGRVLSVEEETSEHQRFFQGNHDLLGTPVVVGSLHSMLAPCAFAFKRAWPRKRLVYLMSDGAALPLALSRAVPQLKERALVDNVITFGNAFGGDYEAVNIYSALVAAKHVCRADAVVVLMGPGVVGTGTKWGTTALEQGIFLNAVQHLRGTPIALVRMSEADSRPRHFGVSHHTLTVLKQIAQPGCIVPLPKLCQTHRAIRAALEDLRHTVTWHDTDALYAALQESALPLSSMGRSPQDDPLFFHAALAGGLEAAKHIHVR
jgi:hypothetical protein